MKMHFGIRFAALAVLGLVAIGARAEAATIAINPSAQNVNVGNSVSVDIVVGLDQGEAVGGAYLDLAFNNAIVTGFSAVHDPQNRMGLAACNAEFALDPVNEPQCEYSLGFTGGNYNLDFLANDELDFAALSGLQGAGFILATLTFQAIAPGTTVLDLLNVALSTADGSAPNALLAITSITDGSITVNDLTGPQPVPEPGTIALFGAGAAILAIRRLRRTRS